MDSDLQPQRGTYRDGDGILSAAAELERQTAIPGPSDPSPSTDQEAAEEPYVKRKLYSAEIIAKWNLTRVNRELGTNEQCVAFAEQNCLLATEKICRSHRTSMKLTKSTNEHFGSWVCHKKTCKNTSGTARTKGTFFENIKMDIRHVFYLIYAYGHNWRYDEAIHEDPLKQEKQSSLSSVTITDWYNYCRESIVLYYLNKQESFGKIGGPGKVVQIVESKFGKRKYNKGRHIEGHWVLGMIEDGSEDLRLEVCPDNIRSADVLVPLIQKHVEVGTIIHTDFWKAYDCLSQYCLSHGYIHKKVNHSDLDNPFVSSDGTHTQRIEAQWRVVKRFFCKENYNNPENFTDLIIEYLWRRNNMKYRKDPFLDVLEAIKYVYKIN